MRLRAVGACRGRRAERLPGARRRRLLLGLEVDPEAPGGLRGHPGPPWWASDRRSEVFQSGGAEADVHVGSADDGQGLAVQTERGGGHGLLGSVSALRLLVPRTCLGLPLIGGDLESGSGGVCVWPVRRVRQSPAHFVQADPGTSRLEGPSAPPREALGEVLVICAPVRWPAVLDGSQATRVSVFVTPRGMVRTCQVYALDGVGYPRRVDRLRSGSGSSGLWCRCLLGMTLLVVNDAHCRRA